MSISICMDMFIEKRVMMPRPIERRAPGLDPSFIADAAALLRAGVHGHRRLQAEQRVALPI